MQVVLGRRSGNCIGQGTRVAKIASNVIESCGFGIDSGILRICSIQTFGSVRNRVASPSSLQFFTRSTNIDAKLH